MLVVVEVEVEGRGRVKRVKEYYFGKTGGRSRVGGRGDDHGGMEKERRGGISLIACHFLDLHFIVLVWEADIYLKSGLKSMQSP